MRSRSRPGRCGRAATSARLRTREPWLPPKARRVSGSRCSRRGSDAKPPRTGLPVRTPFGPKAARASSYAQAAARAKGLSTRFVKPGFAFGSRITARTPRSAASSVTGPPA